MIKIKPHHFVDILTSFGAGQRTFAPHPYGHDVHGVSSKILEHRNVMLEMELGADAICYPCIHNINGQCDDMIDTSFRPDAPASKQEYNLRLDNRWCDSLALQAGDRLTAREFCQRLLSAYADLARIYRELPTEHIARRERHLQQGIEFFLSE